MAVYIVATPLSKACMFELGYDDMLDILLLKHEGGLKIDYFVSESKYYTAQSINELPVVEEYDKHAVGNDLETTNETEGYVSALISETYYYCTCFVSTVDGEIINGVQGYRLRFKTTENIEPSFSNVTFSQIKDDSNNYTKNFSLSAKLNNAQMYSRIEFIAIYDNISHKFVVSGNELSANGNKFNTTICYKDFTPSYSGKKRITLRAHCFTNSEGTGDYVQASVTEATTVVNPSVKGQITPYIEIDTDRTTAHNVYFKVSGFDTSYSRNDRKMQIVCMWYGNKTYVTRPSVSSEYPDGYYHLSSGIYSFPNDGWFSLKNLDASTEIGFYCVFTYTSGGVTYEKCSETAVVTTLPTQVRPDNFSWTYPKEKNKAFNLTKTEWNNFTESINDFRFYKGFERYVFTPAVKGQPFTADMFMEARSAITGMGNGYGSLIAEVIPGDKITANMMNTIVSELNAIP